MESVTLTYKGQIIVAMDGPGSKALKTAGKFCEADILLDYVCRCPRATAVASLCMRDFFMLYEPEASAAEVINEE